MVARRTLSPSLAITEPSRPHVLEAVADTGATLRRGFTTPAQGDRHAVLVYWTSGETRARFTWRIQRQPMAFM